jgi:hypothetical protein
MEPIDPFSYLFDMAGTLTGGIVTDLKTAFLGMLVIGFILIGLDYLKDAFGSLLNGFSHNRHSKLAGDLRDQRDFYKKDTFEYDLYNAAYRKNLRKSLDTFDEGKFSRNHE